MGDQSKSCYSLPEELLLMMLKLPHPESFDSTAVMVMTI